MKYLVLAVVFAAGYLVAITIAPTSAQQQQPVPPNLPVPGASGDRLAPANPNIDFSGYLKIAQEAQQHRDKRRLTEDDFIKMSQEKGVIVLDARSKEKYDLLHFECAINLSFPDIDIESLKKTLPDKSVKILIYCNNNFVSGGPASSVNVTRGGSKGKAAEAFPEKRAELSLNISTYTALYGYGYKNVYELGPVLDPATTKLTLVSNTK